MGKNTKTGNQVMTWKPYGSQYGHYGMHGSAGRPQTWHVLLCLVTFWWPYVTACKFSIFKVGRFRISLYL